jgi:hypothetical protein
MDTSGIKASYDFYNVIISRPISHKKEKYIGCLISYLCGMNSEEIEKFLNTKTTKGNGYVKIDFKKRDTIYGLFVKDNDFSDLKSKNFWRIVTRTHFDEYNKSKNINLAKIFNGAEFSRLSLLTDDF